MSDIGESEQKENLVKEVVLTPEQIELHKIFGTDAKIEKNGDNWKINVQLKDATCHGGQVVEAELERKSKGISVWYEAKDILVDKVSLPKIFKNTFIFRTPERRLGESDESASMFKHLQKFIGTKAFDTGLVQIVSLEDGDGLASIFHEIGHTRDNTPSFLNEIDFYLVSEFVANQNKNSEVTDINQVRESGERILEFEMAAHKFAIKAVEFLQNKGNDMFKDDVDLFRFKKFLITTTMARFNGAPKFIDLVGADRINRILDLDM